MADVAPLNPKASLIQGDRATQYFYDWLRSLRDRVVGAAARFIDGSQLTTGIATYYTVAAGKTATIKKLTITNTTGSAETFDLHLVPSGDSATASNQIQDGVSVAANSTLVVNAATDHVLEAGGTIQALASAGSALTIIASGNES